MSKDSTSDNGKWRYDGVKVVSGQHLDVNTPQTEGMNRAAAINHATAGAEKFGQERFTFIPMPRRALTIMVTLRALFTS